MSGKTLCNLTSQDKDVSIQIQVNRKWEFRGNRDDGPIIHVDIILTDAMVISKITKYIARTKFILSFFFFLHFISFRSSYDCNIYLKSDQSPLFIMLSCRETLYTLRYQVI
jgi:hypothetical protein